MMSLEEKDDMDAVSTNGAHDLESGYSYDAENITRFVILGNDTQSVDDDSYTLVDPNFDLDIQNGGDDPMSYIEEVDNEETNSDIKFEMSQGYEDSIIDKFILVQDVNDTGANPENVKLEFMSNENSMENADDLIKDESLGVDDENTDDDSKLYSCSTCNVSFTNVVEHIHEYHQEQQVMLQMFEEEDNNIFEEICPETVTDDNLDDLIQYDASPMPEDLVDNRDTLKSKCWKMPQILNTLKEEECTDKDGRLYTRKVVQIEKFWDKPFEEGDDGENKVEARTAVPIYYQCIENEDGTPIEHDPQDPELNIKLEPGVHLRSVYHCSRCLVQCADMEEFKAHTCRDELFKCQTCDSYFKSQRMLTAHMQIHKTVRSNIDTKGVGGPYMCFECDTVFPSNKSLRLHRRMHGPIKQKHIEQFYGAAGPEAMDDLPEGQECEPREQFECQVCNKSYDKAFQKIHMGVHSGELQYNCHICNRKFFTESNLAMHMRVHNVEKPQAKKQKGDLPYVCGFCDRQFARPHEKVKHERIHTGEKPHECEICGKRFRVSYCLTLHMRTHTGARPYECPHCHKRFKAHSVYNHHLMTHSDVRAYKCPYCPKAFKTAVQLAGHKNSHTKPFSCTECNRPFASLYAVRGHMEIHKKQNSLKYKCSMCGASYARGFALRDHMKEQHQSTVVSEDDGVVIDESLLDSHLLPEGDTIEIPIEEFHQYDGTELSGAYIKIEAPVDYHEENEEEL